MIWRTVSTWCASTDPFAADARSRPLAAGTVNLRRLQIHAAVTALIASGIEPAAITALADLVSAPNFKRIAQQRLKMAEGRENSFNRAMADCLVQIAREWVKMDAATLAELEASCKQASDAARRSHTEEQALPAPIRRSAGPAAPQSLACKIVVQGPPRRQA